MMFLTALTVPSELKNTYQDRPYLRFDVLSYVPIQADLCLSEMLTKEEKQWMIDYNTSCLKKMSQLIEEKNVLHWLEAQVEKAKTLSLVCNKQHFPYIGMSILRHRISSLS